MLPTKYMIYHIYAACQVYDISYILPTKYMIDMLCACVSCKISHVEPLFSHTYYMTECLQYLNNRDDFNSHMQLSGQCTHPKCDLKSALNPGALLRKAPVKRRWRQSFGETGRKVWAVKASHAKLTVPHQPPLPPFFGPTFPLFGHRCSFPPTVNLVFRNVWEFFWLTRRPPTSHQHCQMGFRSIWELFWAALPTFKKSHTPPTIWSLLVPPKKGVHC